MSTLFDVPCPDCAQPMPVAADGDLECPGCRLAYRLQMGHLFPSGERGPSRPTAGGDTPASPVPA